MNHHELIFGLLLCCGALVLGLVQEEKKVSTRYR